MDTEAQRKKRKAQKKINMQRLCRILDIEGWDQNELILREVRAIVKTEKVQKRGNKGSTKKQRNQN